MDVRCRKESGFLICSSAIPTGFPGLARRPIGNMRRSPLVILIACATVLLPCSVDVARGAGGGFHQGRQLAEQLQVRRALDTEGAVLRDLLDQLQVDYQICILLDRRIDPSTQLSCRIPLVETAELLRRVADEVPDCSVSILDALVYFGPRAEARQLRTLIELQRRHVREMRTEFAMEDYALLTAEGAVGWNDVAAPRDVILQLFNDAGLQTPHPDRVPRDLWHPKQLPVLNVMDVATLLLFQFELSPQLSAETHSVHIVPLPKKIELERRHTIPKTIRKTAKSLIEQRYPGLTAQWTRTSVQISGTLELHAEIELLLAGESPDAATAGSSLKQRTLTLRLQPGVALRQVVTHLHESGISIRYDAVLEPMLDAVVKAELANLPAEDFFRTLFAELPVDVEVTDDEVILQLRDAP